MSEKKIKVLALQSPQIILNALAADFERRTGCGIEHLLRIGDMPFHIAERLAGGKTYDAAFVLPALMDRLIGDGKVLKETRTHFLRVPIGVAVRAGARKPDIGSVEAFKRTVRDAKSIAYLKAGISGPHLERMFEDFGIADELRPRTQRPESDTVGELVAEGKAEIGVTAIATLINTKGVDIVGPIPAELQAYVVFEGAVSANAAAPDMARELIRFVTSPGAVATIRSKGMEPWF